MKLYTLYWEMAPNHPQYHTADPEWYNSSSNPSFEDTLAHLDELVSAGGYSFGLPGQGIGVIGILEIPEGPEPPPMQGPREFEAPVF